MTSFFKLIAQLATQDEPAYCGLTSLVVALNALSVDPGRMWKAPWRWYHEELLDSCLPLSLARRRGIAMTHLVCLAKTNGLEVQLREGQRAEIAQLRQDVMTSCSREDLVLIANYDRPTLDQTGTGHFSPIAGYHQARDLVLILDTARFKYPPHWIPLTTLLTAMNTVDETGSQRGYVLLSRAAQKVSQPPCCECRDSTVSVSTDNLVEKLQKLLQRWIKHSWLTLTSIFKIPLCMFNPRTHKHLHDHTSHGRNHSNAGKQHGETHKETPDENHSQPHSKCHAKDHPQTHNKCPGEDISQTHNCDPTEDNIHTHNKDHTEDHKQSHNKNPDSIQTHIKDHVEDQRQARNVISSQDHQQTHNKDQVPLGVNHLCAHRYHCENHKSH